MPSSDAGEEGGLGRRSMVGGGGGWRSSGVELRR